MMFVEGRLTRPGWLRLTWQAAAVKDAVRRQGGGLATIPIASAKPENCE